MGTYNWRVLDVEVEDRGGFSQVITKVDWELTYTIDIGPVAVGFSTYAHTVYGQSFLEPPNTRGHVPYGLVDEDTVIDWVKDRLSKRYFNGSNALEQTEQSVAGIVTNIYEKRQTTTTYKLPF